MKSWYSITNKSPGAAEIHIYDEIGVYGITAKNFIEELKQVGSRRITLRINSPGGSIFDGLPIYNRLKEHAPGVDVRIDGIAASMASVIAMAGDTISIVENGLIMIHNPQGLALGDSEEMRTMATLLDKLRESLMLAYQHKTKLDSAKLTEYLDAETWFNADESKRLGFVDTIVDANKVAAHFDVSKFRNAPRAASSTDSAKTLQIQNELLTEELEMLRSEKGVEQLSNALNATRGERDKALKQLSLLEGLAGVRGIAPSEAPGEMEDTTQLADVYAEWQRLKQTDPAAATTYFRANKERLRSYAGMVKQR